MKYVLDENLTAKEEDLPDRVINARDLFYLNGFKQVGIDDQKLLKLATKEGYTIITQDQRLIVRANQQKIDIVYSFGRANKKWFFIPKEEDLKNRMKLRKFIERCNIKELINEKPEKVNGFVPFYFKADQ